MPRNKVIQLACAPDIYKKISEYRNDKNLASDAESVRELILFALRILEHSNDDESLTTRELLEEILKYSVHNKYITTQNLYQSYVPDADIYTEETMEKLKGIVSKADKKIEDILSGSEKET